MSRLTVKWNAKVYDLLDPVDIIDNEYSKINFEKMITKLGEYEDLEEMLGIPFEQMVELCKEHVPDGAKYPKRAKVLTDESVDEWEQYKQDKEQGLLLKLPCKVGDKAYYVNKGHIDEVEIDSFVLNINLFVNVSYCIGCERFGKTLTSYKTLFFTKEEAEQELKRMECAE